MVELASSQDEHEGTTMNAPEMNSIFPPVLAAGARVWTTKGYRDHGPIEGPKVDIAGSQGGTVQATTKPSYMMDQSLYTVRWDNGQTSKHYASGLFCIGRFGTFEEFVVAIVPHEPIEVTLGPQGGFRAARFSLTYDGHTQIVSLLPDDRQLWFEVVEPIVKARGMKITEMRLTPTRAKKRTG